METLSDQLVSLVTYLDDLTVAVPALDLEVPILEILHAILINYIYRSSLHDNHSHIGWAQGLLVTVVMSAGGGSTVSILRGETLGILKNNAFWGIYGVVYWLMFSNPFLYQFVQFLFTIPLAQQLLVVADGILRTNTVIGFGIDGVASHPALGNDKWVAKIICGTLAGSAGGIWTDTLGLAKSQWSFSTPRLLTSPSIDMYASFLASVFYVIATTPGMADKVGLLDMTPTEAQAWSAVILSSGLIYKSSRLLTQTEPNEQDANKKNQ